MQEVEILRVGVETEHGLDPATADAKPRFEFVLYVSPIQLGIPLSQCTEISIIKLRADTELVGELHGGIDSEIGKFPAAKLRRFHGEPVVVVGMNKSLGGKAVDLQFVAFDLQVLGADVHLTHNKTDKAEPNR